MLLKRLGFSIDLIILYIGDIRLETEYRVEISQMHSLFNAIISHPKD